MNLSKERGYSKGSNIYLHKFSKIFLSQIWTKNIDTYVWNVIQSGLALFALTLFVFEEFYIYDLTLFVFALFGVFLPPTYRKVRGQTVCSIFIFFSNSLCSPQLWWTLTSHGKVCINLMQGHCLLYLFIFGFVFLWFVSTNWSLLLTKEEWKSFTTSQNDPWDVHWHPIYCLLKRQNLPHYQTE